MRCLESGNGKRSVCTCRRLFSLGAANAVETAAASLQPNTILGPPEPAGATRQSCFPSNPKTLSRDTDGGVLYLFGACI